VRAFEPALELGRSTTLNVAGTERVTITDLVGLIGELAGRPAIVTHGPAQPEGDLVADIGRLREVLDITPEVSLRDGLRSALGVPSSS
jgi:nucleoside-diphosphate-sugar epimerase